MRGVNSVFLAGYIDSNIMSSTTFDNEAVAAFLLKVSSKPDVVVRINCYGEIAKYSQKLKKDDFVFIKGELMNRKFQKGKEGKDGLEFWLTEVKAIFLCKREYICADSEKGDNEKKEDSELKSEEGGQKNG